MAKHETIARLHRHVTENISPISPIGEIQINEAQAREAGPSMLDLATAFWQRPTPGRFTRPARPDFAPIAGTVGPSALMDQSQRFAELAMKEQFAQLVGAGRFRPGGRGGAGWACGPAIHM